MALTLDDITRSYEKLKDLSRRRIRAGRHPDALAIIQTAATIAYHVNWIYTDDELEAQLREISDRTIRPERFTPVPGRFVFFDSWGWDNRGLTQQYVAALKHIGAEFLFVFENQDERQSQRLRAELRAYDRCEVFALDRSRPAIERMDALYRRIAAFRPERLLMHITPWAAEALAAFHALPGVLKYQINLTDHAFWLGARCLDYCLEFRDYGCTVSLEKRGLMGEQLLKLPYYPITASEPFRGLPDTRGRVVIFSGSSFYKILGRDGAFFRLARRLLDENPEAVLLFAGGGDERPVRRFIRESGLDDRFLLLGHRPDVTEVFARCDIYLGTYPICGGLMSQLAAAHGKPILAFTTPDLPCNYIEGIVSAAPTRPITATSEEELLGQARRLVQDEQYRRRTGEELRASLTSRAEFDRSFERLLESNEPPHPFARERIDFDAFSELYLEVENRYLHSSTRLLAKAFRAKMPLLFPVMFLKSIPALASLALRARAYAP